MTNRFGQLRGLGLLALAAGMSVAAQADAAYLDWYTATEVGCYNSGECFIKIDPPIPNDKTTCSDRSQVRFDGTTVGGQLMHKNALAGFLAGRKLGIRTYSSTCVATHYTRVSYVKL